MLLAAVVRSSFASPAIKEIEKEYPVVGLLHANERINNSDPEQRPNNSQYLASLLVLFTLQLLLKQLRGESLARCTLFSIMG